MILAFSVHSFVDKIGAYVAFAAAVGLALMALLLFAQARELRRLREWGAHAHDRIGELERRLAAALELARRASAPQRTMPPSGGRTVASPAARPAAGPGAPAGAGPRGPVPARTSSPTRLPLLPAAPVGVGAAALGSATVVLPLPKHPPAVATPEPAGTGAVPATTVAPVARSAAAAAMPSVPAAAPAVAASAAPASAPAVAASPPAPATAAGQGAAAQPPAPAPAMPAPVEAPTNGHSDTFPPVPPVRRPLPPTRAGGPAGRAPVRPGASARGAVRPGTRPPAAAPLRQRSAPSASPRGAGGGAGGGTDRRGGDPSGRPRIVLLLVGLAVVAAIAIAVLALSGGGGSSPSHTSASTGALTRQATSTARSHTPAGTTVPHGRITVAVLNGTATPGLANTVADTLIGAGFVKGPVDNASDQQRSVTVVSYFDGHEAEAQEVAQTLRVPADAVQPIDIDTERACGQGAPSACTAPVVVTVGADR